jgi:hypothetical protein
VADAVVVDAVEVQDAGDGLVEQVEVVADDEQRAAVLAHEAEEPLLRVAVEVVGGLVEQEHVAAREEDAGDLHPASLATRQGTDGQVEAVLVEAEASRDAQHLALGRVPTVEPELLLGPTEPLDGPLGGVFLHLQPELLDADQRVVEPPTRQDVAHGGDVVVDAVEPGILREVAEPPAAVDDTGERVGRAAQHLQQARLPGPVPADEAHLVTGADREAGPLEDEVAAHFDGELTGL